MATRKPTVMISGQLQDLPTGDTLVAGVAGTVIRAGTTNNESSVAIVIGMAVYSSVAGGVKRAQSNALSTSSVTGLWADTTTAAAGTGNLLEQGTLVATTVQWDAVAGTTGGLVFNTRYYLDPTTPGKITGTAPTAAGQAVVPIGVALSTTDLDVQIGTPYLLA